tara:strand:+ start:12181 stop:13584 length:1404 start_codon:yes stop_codon:yes gene_type:complete
MNFLGKVKSWGITEYLYFQKVVILLVLILFTSSCIKDRNFEILKTNCTENLIANTTYDKVRELYIDQTIQIQEDLIIEGYVISSDKAGNFFSVLYFQDDVANSTDGLQIEMDLRDTHLFYPIGTKIIIKLKGLYLGKNKEVYKIGGVFSSFGNLSVGRLPTSIINQHVFVSCEIVLPIIPTQISLEDSLDSYVNTLVTINNIEFSLDEIGATFAIEAEETKLVLINCNDEQISLINSGYSDFQSASLPMGSGNITGILFKENNELFIVIRDLNDIDFTNERCADVIDEFSSTNIFISELADPDNNSGARFVELYNSSSESLSLKGWTLRRYTNANVEVSSTISLTGYEIQAKSTFVLSPNALEFGTVYGFAPDLEVGTNSPADSNGDDTIELVDPFGVVIDVFGVIGEDGSGTNHEFEDGRAVRKQEINQGNSSFTFNEWTIFNDTGDLKTINKPQNAPDDFNPKIR